MAHGNDNRINKQYYNNNSNIYSMKTYTAIKIHEIDKCKWGKFLNK